MMIHAAGTILYVLLMRCVILIQATAKVSMIDL